MNSVPVEVAHLKRCFVNLLWPEMEHHLLKHMGLFLNKMQCHTSKVIVPFWQKLAITEDWCLARSVEQGEPKTKTG